LGKSGSGKTYFLARFIQELTKKAKNVGILVLNVAKESQEIFYYNFDKVKYSDIDFPIPYFINSEKEILRKRLQETATYICASLGLKNVFEKIIYRTEVGFLDLKGKLPEFFMGFFLIYLFIPTIFKNRSFNLSCPCFFSHDFLFCYLRFKINDEGNLIIFYLKNAFTQI